MRDVEITKQPIELFKLLKLGNIVSTGGEAKNLIDEGRVLVNGTVETQKRKKIFSGNIVEFEKEKICVKLK